MLRYVNSSTAILTAKRESLEHANEEENYRRGESDRRIGRQETDRGGGAAHDQQRHEKRVLASYQIADTSKEKRPKRPDDKSDCEGREVSDKRECVVTFRVEERCDRYGETAKDIKVVPLDHGTDR